MTILEQTYLEFKKIPKGFPIDRPYDLVETNFAVSQNVIRVTGSNKNVYFTRKSLKHLSEKGKRGDILLNIIPFILEDPEEIRKKISSGRYLIVKAIINDDANNQPHVVVLEVAADMSNLIITSFTSTRKYIANSNLLWRTEASLGDGPSICISPK